MRLGIHTSIGAGFDKAVKNLVDLNCNACQLFSRSPRGGKARTLGNSEVQTFRNLCSKHDISPVVIHIPYVLNPATSDSEMHEYATAMIREDINRADTLGASHLVLHMGSHRGAGMETGLSQVVKALNNAVKDYQGQTVLLLENTSGAGSEVGNTFEQLAWILERLDTSSAGICFDTCHGFAAGYDLSDHNKVDNIVNQIEGIIGLSRLKIIHANDAMFPLGSTKDRHAHIGQGYIGEQGFKALLHHPELQGIPFILETPIDDKGDWSSNLATMRRLAEK